MRYVLIALFCFAVPANAAPPRNADSLSFAELYRLTVQGVSTVEPGATAPEQYSAQSAEYQVRVASLDKSAATPVAPSYSFSAPVLPEPSSRWLLVLSGLALAGWVARRRLGYSL